MNDSGDIKIYMDNKYDGNGIIWHDRRRCLYNAL